MASLGRTWTAPAPERPRLVLGAQAATLGVAAAFIGSTLIGRDGFDGLLDGWVQGVGYVLIAALAALRALLSRVDRLVWALVAAALTARAIGFGTYLSVVRELDPVPYPSVADGAWLLSCALLLAAMVRFSQSRFTLLPSALVLDGLVGACAVGAAAVLVLPDTVDRLSPDGTTDAALVTNALYPAADVALLLAVLGVLLAYRWRPPPALWVFAVGVVGFAVLDCLYLYRLSNGTFRPATPLSGLSMLATLVMGLAAWAPPGRFAGAHDDDRESHLPGLLIPAGLAGCCLVLLVAAALGDAPAGAVWLAAAGLAATVARTVLGFRDLHHLAVVRQEARTDDLTGLANRRAFNEQVERALHQRAAGRPLALLVLDLDSFKEVNDSLGHHRGDELLGLVAQRLSVASRPQDLLARIGGDEFAILLEGADAPAAAQVAERLRTASRGPFTIASQVLTVGVSVGIAVFPQDGHDPATLLQHADSAMYSAKDDRTGQSFFRPDQHQAGRARLETVAQMRAAIDGGQFLLHYQPKIRLDGGDVVGVEALVRWAHPTQGLLAPYAFLPQAERGGLMRELTMSLLHQALAQQQHWARAGTPTTIALNLSVSDLLDRSFPAAVAGALAQHGTPGSALVLELTEDLLLADPARGHGVILALADLGVRVQVDDYGTGFSTLGYLRDLPSLQGLKLDRSFVTDLVRDRRRRAIVASTVALAADLGLDLVAEGVEDEATREALAALGCPQAQGFLFARPVSAELVRFGRYDATAGLLR
jgi:diguanylate cyclase (GGDEF)-like protein